jgi:hypothetical protein
LKKVLIALAAVLLAASCTNDTDDGAVATVAPPGELTEDHVTFGAFMAQVNGHHQIALELYRAGDEEGAEVHTGHPIAEILDSVKPDVAEQDADLAGELETALESAAKVVADGGPAADLSAAITDTKDVVDRAETAVVGERTDTYTASVVASLLDTSAHEYEEAVADGKIAEVVEYQDARAFVAQAKALYGDIEDDVAKDHPEEAAEIDEDFEKLESALPGANPPASAVIDAEEFEATAKHTAAELQETVGLIGAKDVSKEEAFANIDALLTEILEKYEAGEAEEAAELAAEAYLENYELIEADVIELAPEINEKLEPILGSQLRARIREDVPEEDLAALIDEARELLDQAEEALAEEH